MLLYIYIVGGTSVKSMFFYLLEYFLVVYVLLNSPGLSWYYSQICIQRLSPLGLCKSDLIRQVAS